MDSETQAQRFVPAKRVIVAVDLSNFTRGFIERGDAQIAAFLDRYYALCERVLAAAAGRVVKFMGDACLAVFPAELAGAAVAAVIELQRAVEELAREQSLPFGLGANLHLAEIIEAELGSGASKAQDIVGRGVNQTFLLGRGTGIRISEPVYRSLASGERSPWKNHKPPAVYSFSEPGEPYAGAGKDPATNALRW